MSAYGTILQPKSLSDEPLKQLLFPLPDKSKSLLIVPFRREDVPDELAEHLHILFNGIVREGRTYPQEDELTLQGFKDYYLAYNLFVGILIPTDILPASEDVQHLAPHTFTQIKPKLTSASWSDLAVGCYYVKPNYPGRSSHCCNGGFVVDPRSRGLQIGRTLGKSYLYYAPRLGYKYSVFNLVYVNNIASVKIWDSLGFQRAGLVPKVGRLKTADGEGEEYVDAYVYWRDLSV